MASWERFLPDFQVKIWNLEMCQPYFNDFFSQAIDKRMYAFASDYVRFKVIQEFGGIYMDLDMLLIRAIPESIMNEKFFIGLQDGSNLGFGIFGSIPYHPVLEPIEKKTLLR